MIKNNRIIYKPCYIYEVKLKNKSAYFTSRKEAREHKRASTEKGLKIYKHHIVYTNTIIR